LEYAQKHEDIDILIGSGRSPEFLRKSPAGGVLVLELDDGTYLAESAAISRYIEVFIPSPT